MQKAAGISIGALALLMACTNSDDLKQIQESQRLILAKIGDLEKKIEQAKAPAPPQRPPVDPNKVYNIPLGNSPFRGAANGRVVLAEFSDFQ